MGKDSGPGAKDRVGSLFSLRPLFGVQLKSNIKVLVGGGGGGGRHSWGRLTKLI